MWPILKWSAFNSKRESMISKFYQSISSVNCLETSHSHSASALRRFYRKTDFLERQTRNVQNFAFDDSSQHFRIQLVFRIRKLVCFIDHWCRLHSFWKNQAWKSIKPTLWHKSMQNGAMSHQNTRFCTFRIWRSKNSFFRQNSLSADVEWSWEVSKQCTFNIDR
jgi:hypothetical protein